MVLEFSPVTKIQIGSAMALESRPLLATYLLSCEVEDKTQRTIQTYKQRIIAFLEYIKPENEKSAKPNDIRLFLYSLKQSRINPSTINAYYRALNTYFNWLVTEEEVEKSPLLNIKPPKFPKLLPQPFSIDNLKALIREASSTRFLDLRNRALILMFLETGIRLSEMARLKIADVDFNRGAVKIFGKGAKERVVAIQKGTQRALLQYLLKRQDNHDSLWVSEEREPLTQWGIKNTIVKLCQRAGIKGGPHKFRHTAAILCLRNGMHEFTLQLMLGHSSLVMTRRYVSSLGTEDLLKEHRTASPVDNLKL